MQLNSLFGQQNKLCNKKIENTKLILELNNSKTASKLIPTTSRIEISDIILKFLKDQTSLSIHLFT